MKNKIKQKEFIEMINKYKMTIYRISFLYSRGKRCDLDDIKQEIYEHLWRGFKKFTKDDNILAWIYTVALNTAKLHYKKDISRLDMIEEWDETIKEKYIIKEEENIRLYSIQEKLTQRENILLEMYLGGLTFLEISEILGKTEQEIKKSWIQLYNKMSDIGQKLNG